MPEVDMKKVEKEAVEAPIPDSIERKVVGGKSYYQGPHADKWFDNYDECIRVNQKIKNESTMKGLGLNEHGQTKEQEKKMVQRAKLLGDRKKILEKLSELDEEIAQLGR